MEKQKAKIERERLEKPQPFKPLQIPLPSTSHKYPLSSHIINPCRRRSHSVISSAATNPHKQLLAAPSTFSPAHSSSSSRRIAATTIPASDSEFRSPWEEDYNQPKYVEHQPPSPTSSSSLHVQEFLSQLASTMSTMTSAFAKLQASLHTYNTVGGHGSMSEAEKAIVAHEFQRIAHLEKGLHSLVQQYGMQEEISREKSENKCTFCNGATMDENINNVIEKKDAMLTSYEGIITRFLDEIKRKDAVTHALKDTLAKSLLKGEKLERRIKALEATTTTPLSWSLTPK